VSQLCREPGNIVHAPLRRHRPHLDEFQQRQFVAHPCGAESDLIRELRPHVVLHFAAMTNIADALRDPTAAAAVNEYWTRDLAAAAEAVGAVFAYSSTDMVFDGEPLEGTGGFDETATPRPLSVYGHTKLAGEIATREASPRFGFVVRLPLMFGPPNRTADAASCPYAAQLRSLCASHTGVSGPVAAFKDEIRTPLWYSRAAAKVIALAKVLVEAHVNAHIVPHRIYHVAGPQRVSRLELLQAMARGVPSISVAEATQITTASSQVEYNLTAREPRPRDLSLIPRAMDQILPSGHNAATENDDDLNNQCREALDFLRSRLREASIDSQELLQFLAEVDRVAANE
jgi:dTDP-4-dehydrorhamnose reductase